MTKGVVSQLGSCVEETDIDQILTELATYLPELVAGLVTERSTDDNRAKMGRFLKSWIDSNKEDATWIALIGRIKKINKKAAKKIKGMGMRCPAGVVQIEDQEHLAEVEDQEHLAEVEDQEHLAEVEDQELNTADNTVIMTQM